MADYNGNSNKQTIEEQYCTMCQNHCSKDALSCGRGRRFFQVEQREECDNAHSMRNVHDNGGRYGSKHHQGDKKRHGHHKNHHTTENGTNMDDLGSLMRACGHFLYHSAQERNGQGRIMHILSSRGSISQMDLQEMLGIQPGSISEILSKVEGKGLISRRKSEEDKRKIIVELTEAGKQHVTEYRASHRNRDKFAALSEEQKEQLKELLSILVASWEK